jgi:hypothetical protein
MFVQTERLGAGRNQVCLSNRIAAREKRYVMALGNEFFRKIRNNAFCTPIEFRWNALIEGSDLSNFHEASLRSVLVVVRNPRPPEIGGDGSELRRHPQRFHRATWASLHSVERLSALGRVLH